MNVDEHEIHESKQGEEELSNLLRHPEEPEYKEGVKQECWQRQYHHGNEHKNASWHCNARNDVSYTA